MIENLKKEMEEKLETVIKKLQDSLLKVRTGRASANVLDGVSVDYYGAATPLNQVGQVSTPEARLLQIQPFDKTMIAAIEKAILGANLGLTPSNDGNVVRIPFPALTEDKRKDIVKDIKKLGEESKIQVRNNRRDQNDKIKKLQKDKEISEDESKKFQSDVQVVTDKYIKKIDEVVSKRESEVMTV